MDESGIDHGNAILALVYVKDDLTYEELKRKLTWKKRNRLEPALRLVHDKTPNSEFKFNSFMRALDGQPPTTQTIIRQRLKEKLSQLSVTDFGVIYVHLNLDRIDQTKRDQIIQNNAHRLMRYSCVLLQPMIVKERHLAIYADKGFFKYAKFKILLTRYRGDAYKLRINLVSEPFRISTAETEIFQAPVQGRHSHDIKGLQIADLMAGALRQNENGNNEFFGSIEPRLKMSIKGDSSDLKSLENIDLKQLQRSNKIKLL